VELLRGNASDRKSSRETFVSVLGVTISSGAANLIRIASRAIGRAGLAHAYGHCSLRLDAHHCIVSPAKPLGLVSDSDMPVPVPIEAPLSEEVLGEVRIHQQIYRLRTDVRGIVRFQSPKIVSLSALAKAPRVLHGFGSYFAPQPPFWRDTRLVRDNQRAAAVAAMLGTARAIVLRGNGAVTVGSSLQEACVLAWYLEDAARVELDVLASGEPGLAFDPEESSARATMHGKIFERMWDWMTRDEPAQDRVPYGA
jgi:HCOMODA/2-hydroxy-3-carboxy-muconic semialdehyde decarboxylase